MLQEKWGFLHSGCHDAATNMALDELLLLWHQKGMIPPTLRFYRWSSPSLSVGYFQKTANIIDFAALKRHQCQFVRRMTGGSTVLHDDELTYSIVISEDHPLIPKTIREAYYTLSKGLIAGYRRLGIQPEHATAKKLLGKKGTAVCFEEPAYYELVVDGKKISGNAQIRKNGVLLQHGSIPLSIDTNMLFDLFHFPSEQIKQQRKLAFKQKATTINELTNRRHHYEQVKDAFFAGFQTAFNVSFAPITLSDKQWEEVNELATTKYATDILHNDRTFTENKQKRSHVL